MVAHPPRRIKVGWMRAPNFVTAPANARRHAQAPIMSCLSPFIDRIVVRMPHFAVTSLRSAQTATRTIF
jgi:hypothetical protein